MGSRGIDRSIDAARKAAIATTAVMGFSNLLKCIENSGVQDEKFDWTNKSDDLKPCIIVDHHNVVMDMSMEGGHCAFMKARCECLFGALVNSGANICIVSDGKYCSEERSVIKLGRMHKEIEWRKNKSSILKSDCISNLAYSIFDETFRKRNVENVSGTR